MIMVDILPGDFETYRDGMTEESQTRQGGKLLSKDDVEVAKGKAFLAKTERPMQGRVYHKWMLHVGDGRGVFRVSGVYDVAMESEMSAVLKDAVLSARRSGSAEAAVAEVPDFTVKPEKPLKLAKKEKSGQRIYAEDGRYPMSSVTDLLLIAAPSASTGTVPDRKKFAISRIKDARSVKSVKVDKSKKLRIDGLEAWEILATADHDGTGVELLLFETIVFDEVQYYIFIGYAGEDRRSEALKVFRKTVKSFERVKAK
jgi:hypothetical protein